MVTATSMTEVIDFFADVYDLKCKKKGWRRDWLEVGCYLMLESSEYTESLRHKGGIPEYELADCLFVLLSSIRHNNIDISKVVEKLYELIE